MVWKNKGHESDDIANQLIGIYSRAPQIYAFGAGIKGKEIAVTLQKYNCFAGYIDNNLEKQKQGFANYRVFSLSEFMSQRDGLIVISASHKNIPIIDNQLKSFGLLNNVDYFWYDKFCNDIFPILSLYYYNMLFISLAQISLTERCTLKCKKCAHGCFAVDNRVVKDLTVEQVYKSADFFFSKVDFIKEFVLIGGEPLLYGDLENVIRYIGKKYRDKIGIYSITTNGTIIPKEEVLYACREYDVLFRISNYVGQLPRLKDKYERLTRYLKKNDILYLMEDEGLEWMDYGFDYLNRKATKDKLIEVFDSCHTPCREIRENRFYYCVMARSVSENLGYYIGQEDYLDLEKMTEDNYKKEILEFTLGYSSKGYLDMCNHCYGAEAKKHPIPVAEQME